MGHKNNTNKKLIKKTNQNKKDKQNEIKDKIKNQTKPNQTKKKICSFNNFLFYLFTFYIFILRNKNVI